MCTTNVRGYFPTITVVMCIHMQLLLTVVFDFVFRFLQRKLLHFLRELAQHFVVRLKKYVCSLRVLYRGEVEMVCGGGSISIVFLSSLIGAQTRVVFILHGVFYF